jgi:hypothetical protein
MKFEGFKFLILILSISLYIEIKHCVLTGGLTYRQVNRLESTYWLSFSHFICNKSIINKIWVKLLLLIMKGENELNFLSLEKLAFILKFHKAAFFQTQITIYSFHYTQHPL